jgi:hypothetical protein
VYLISNDGTRADQVGLLHGFTEAGAISHDGRRVAFLFDDTVLPPSGPACPSGSPCVAILSVDSPQQLCQVPLGELDLGGAGPGQPGVAWSPSDDRIALALPGETRSAVAVVGISTCSLLGSPLATPSAHAGDATLPMLGSPIGWSADGRSLFTRARDPGGPWVVRRIAADGTGSAREIARDVDWFDLSGR